MYCAELRNNTYKNQVTNIYRSSKFQSRNEKFAYFLRQEEVDPDSLIARLLYETQNTHSILIRLRISVRKTH